MSRKINCRKTTRLSTDAAFVVFRLFTMTSNPTVLMIDWLIWASTNETPLRSCTVCNHVDQNPGTNVKNGRVQKAERGGYQRGSEGAL